MDRAMWLFCVRHTIEQYRIFQVEQLAYYYTYDFVGRLRRRSVAELDDLLRRRQELTTAGPRRPRLMVLTEIRRTCQTESNNTLNYSDAAHIERRPLGSRPMRTFFFDGVLLFALPEVVFGQQQHAAHQICCGHTFGALDLSAIRWIVE